MIVQDLFDRVKNARNLRQKALQRNTTGLLALGVSIGCTVGAVAGVLFAPRAGKETREAVSRRSCEAWGKIKDNVSSNGHRLANAIEEQGTRVYTAAEKGIDAAKEALHDSSGKPEKAEKADSKKIVDNKQLVDSKQ